MLSLRICVHVIPHYFADKFLENNFQNFILMQGERKTAVFTLFFTAEIASFQSWMRQLLKNVNSCQKCTRVWLKLVLLAATIIADGVTFITLSSFKKSQLYSLLTVSLSKIKNFFPSKLKSVFNKIDQSENKRNHKSNKTAINQKVRKVTEQWTSESESWGLNWNQPHNKKLES